MHRFFVDKNYIIDNTVTLSSDDSVHAAKVLRLRVGDCVSVCDCSGFDYDAVITHIDKNSVELRLSDRRPTETEADMKITLIQALPKTGKMEVIIQKCVELGVCDFIPIETERCVVKTDKKSTAGKLDRYNKIAYEAAKQSMRGIVPVVHEFSSLRAVDYSQYDVIIIPYEEERQQTLRAFIDKCTVLRETDVKIAVIIGPEGGFEKEEVDFVREKGGASITLGKRILRTETAGMATVAMLMGILEG